jgi:hypothetical protein
MANWEIFISDLTEALALIEAASFFGPAQQGRKRYSGEQEKL